MKQRNFKINLDLTIINKLRNKINEHQNISMKKEFDKKIGKINKKFNSWDIVCATMDRIEDTVYYLNELVLNTGKYRRNAFDFIDFINNAMMIIDCINELADVYNVNLEVEDSQSEKFNQLGKNGKGTDLKYFKYIRSLCSVHPNDTSRHKEYQDNDFECSPFVVWNNGLYPDDIDICIVTYINEINVFSKKNYLRINEIFNFIEYRYSLIEKIINEIDIYQQNMINTYKNIPLMQEEEFNTYSEYLEYLKKEEEERLGSRASHLLEYAINVFDIRLSNPDNSECFEKYKNVIKYAITFIHKEIQNLTREGFENCGIKDNIYNSTLLELILYDNNKSEKAKKYSYNIEKLEYLNGNNNYRDRIFGIKMLKVMIPFLQKYISFDNVRNDEEYYVLAKVALYNDSLQTECDLNKNIPVNKKYRNI